MMSVGKLENDVSVDRRPCRGHKIPLDVLFNRSCHGGGDPTRKTLQPNPHPAHIRLYYLSKIN